MEELEKAILRESQKAIGEAIKSNLTGYNSSLHKLVDTVVEEHRNDLKKIIDENFTTVLKSDDFKEAVRSTFNHSLARLLVAKLEGSVEKAVNVLRSDPTLRAKMILAIEGIINEK